MQHSQRSGGLAEKSGWDSLSSRLASLDTDGTIMFYQHVQACHIAVDAKNVLDFGAGRGGALVKALEDGETYRAYLLDQRSLGAHVTACDIEDAVLSHPAADEKVVMESDERLPFANASFDLIVSDFAFEHIEKPEAISAELVRVLRPGGMLCARTPNRYSYVALAASIMPEKLYAGVLKKAQPNRQDQDKFEVIYKMNDAQALRAIFPGCEVLVRYPNFEPSYYFGSRVVKGAFDALHRVLPKKLRTGLIVTVYKPAPASTNAA